MNEKHRESEKWNRRPDSAARSEDGGLNDGHGDEEPSVPPVEAGIAGGGVDGRGGGGKVLRDARAKRPLRTQSRCWYARAGQGSY